MNFFTHYKKIKDSISRGVIFSSRFLRSTIRKSVEILSSFSKSTALPKTILLLLLAVGPIVFHQAHAQWGILPDGDLIVARLLYIPIAFSGWILGLSGVLLNAVLDYTVVHMTVNLTGITGINIAWSTIRDLSNMSFIFVLLYISISTVLGLSGSQWKKTLGTVVIAAVLLNFSLFMTKVMIDASNVFTLGIYRQIVTDPDTKIGLSDSIMQPLGLTTLYKLSDANSIKNTDWSQMFIVSIGSSAFMLITAFVFLAVAVMFLIRYITIIFLLILSPVAVMGLLPQFSGSAKKWWNQLTGQLTFAPVYMIMTWAVITIIGSSEFVCRDQLISDTLTNLAGSTADSAGQIGGACAGGSIGTILNFVIVIGMAIASLTIAKGISNQSKGGAEKLVHGALGYGAGAAGFGGRQVGGRAGRMVADSERLKGAAAKGGMVGYASRMTLKGGQSAAAGSYDVRSSRALGLAKSAGIDVGIGGKAGGKGGFDKIIKDGAEKKKKFGDSLDSSDIVKDQAQQDVDNAKLALEKDPENIKLQKNLAEKKDKLVQVKGFSKEDAEKKNKEAIQKKAAEAREDAATKRAEAVAAKTEAEEKVRAEVTRSPELQKKKSDLETLKASAENMELPEADREQAQQKIKQLDIEYDALNKKHEEEVARKVEEHLSNSTAQKEAVEAEKEAARLQNLTDKKKTDERDAELKAQNELVSEIKSVGDKRKEKYADNLSSGLFGKSLKRTNLQAGADLRKKKKPIKDQLQKILEEAGDIKKPEPDEEKSEDKPKEETKS